MKTRHALWLLLSLMPAILGCTGDTGPAGPKGPAGPAGSANVIYSEWISPASWTLGLSFGVHERTYTMTAPLLTEDIIGQGVVLVYIKFVGWSPAISQLPVTIFSSPQTYCFYFRAEPGSIKAIYYYQSSPATDPISIDAANQVRYVLIPGGVLAASAQRAGSTSIRLTGSLQSMPYSEVCRLFNIPE